MDGPIELGSGVIVECGPKRKRAVATEGLLARVAARYHVGAFDAAGERIELGREMEYLDHYGEREWIVYEWRPAMLDERGKPTADEALAVKDKVSGAPVLSDRWMPVRRFDSKDEAMKAGRQRARARTISGFFRKPDVWRGEE